MTTPPADKPQNSTGEMPQNSPADTPLNPAFYGHYQSLTLKRHDHGILEIVMGAAKSANGKLSTADHNMHKELSTIWQDIDKDPDTRVALIQPSQTIVFVLIFNLIA